MKRKARIQTGIDDRLVAIYARKSRITNKGDSIGVQFKQSADYAINQLSLPEDYEFARYEDKGLSGYYSDRPDFQRLLRDIEMGKIKAVACYKLDRISRKTSDLMRLLEYFERHDVTLLVCSNNINTRISTSKIIIQVLAIIAEFERDILTERIQDNLMELAKDGRWLGGKTPTGFSSQRVTTGSGKNKSAISFLVPVQEEKEIVLEIYGTFWETRSLLQTANIISEKYETKHGAKFTTSTIRLILRNPIYCVADEYSYNYFLEHDGNLFGEPSDFDGQHGLTAYNKTDQMKVEDEDSTFFNPKFSQLLTRKPISEWIVSVGRHEGFISSRKWVETQNMLDEIAEKYNRPHRKTNALLSGLMYCPICGKRLRVLPESNRWTNGKPRFKYACPGVRAKECTFKGVEGVTLDEFVIHSLSSLQEEHSDYYRQLLENRVASMIRTDQSEKEYQETKKAIERLNADIAAQVRNLREADDALKRFIQDDIKELTDELAKREAALRRMEDTQSENQYLIHELNGMKKRLLSFEEFAKDAQPEALFTLVHSIVDRIYITTDGTKQKCQVYIKGCATEDYSDVLGAAGYIEEEPLLPVVSYMPPMCDLDYYSIFTGNIFVRCSAFKMGVSFFSLKVRFLPFKDHPALNNMVFSHPLYRWNFGAALLRAVLAAIRKPTPLLKIIHSRHSAGYGVERLLFTAHSRYGGHQSLGVGMQRVVENRFQCATLNGTARIHHHHLLADLCHDPQIVRNQHQTAGGSLQAAHDIQDLRLDRYIQCGGRFVGNQYGGMVDNGHGDHYPLAHTAGKFMRILIDPGLRIGNAHIIQRLTDLFPNLIFLHFRMVQLQTFANLLADRHDWIQRCHWLLKDHCDLLSPDLFHLRLRLFQQILSIEQDLSSLYRGRSRQKPHQRKAGHAFAAAGFAYDPQSLSFVQLHIQMVDQVVDLSVIVLKTHAVILELYLC